MEVLKTVKEVLKTTEVAIHFETYSALLVNFETSALHCRLIPHRWLTLLVLYDSTSCFGILPPLSIGQAVFTVRQSYE